MLEEDTIFLPSLCHFYSASDQMICSICVTPTQRIVNSELCFRTLERGDSGSIVYQVKDQDKLRPIAMFTGEASGTAGKVGNFYEATFLSVALKDIEKSTPLPKKLKLLGDQTRKRQAHPPKSQKRKSN